MLEVLHLALWNIFDIILLDFIWGKVKKICIYLKKNFVIIISVENSCDA